MKRVVLFLFIIYPLLALNAQSSHIDWDYPIMPGTDAWKMLKNHKEKTEICQIPVEILHTLSTQRLFELCRNYPLISDIIAFNNIQDGFNAFKRNFNGIEELLNRDDFPLILIDEYSKIDPMNYEKEWSNYKKGMFSFNLIFLELFISQYEVIDNLDATEKKALVKILISKKDKMLRCEIYDYIGIMSVYFTMSRIMLSDNTTFHAYTDERFNAIAKFSEKGNLRNVQLIQNLDSLTVNYLK